MVGSSKYAPLTNLPSQNLPPVTLPPHCAYRPSWLQHADRPAPQPPANAPQPLPSVPSAAPGQPVAPYPASPPHAAFRPPPPPYELPSPATSTASSYLNRNLNSVEAAATPSVQRTPEANSLTLNVLLSDTAFYIFRDHNFDSCALCVCDVVGNIRGADVGVYLMNTGENR